MKRTPRTRQKKEFIITEQVSYIVNARCASEALSKLLNSADPNQYFKECTDRQVWAT